VFQWQEATMNILKYKKLLVMALTFVLFMTLVQPPLLAAKERRGSTVVVTMIAGRGTVKGELLAVKADALLVFDHDTLLSKSIDLKDVFQVKVLKKLNFLNGMAIGMVVGLGMLIYQNELSGQPNDSLVPDFVVPLTTGLYGGLIGLFVRITKKISLDGASSEITLEKLKQLKRYAREQD
jgi:hypothetical protein